MNIEKTYNDRYRDIGFIIGFAVALGVAGGSLGAVVCQIVGAPLKYHWIPSLPLFLLMAAMTVQGFFVDIKSEKRNRLSATVILLAKSIAIMLGVAGTVLLWISP